MATKKARASEGAGSDDAIAMLIADHKKVKKLFLAFKKLSRDGGSDEKRDLVENICTELKIHTALEEEIFYPAVRQAIDDSELMDEALVEHAGAKELIAQLEKVDPEEELYDAKVIVLSERIDHHVEEEESTMFPRAKKAKVDTAALGARMLERKKALRKTLGVAENA